MKSPPEKIASAKGEVQRLALAAQLKTPPDQDWLFTRAQAPRNYQLYAWLEYEYGRSSRLLCDQVAAVRQWQPQAREVGEHPEPSPGCRFACLLAKHAPEFPDQAWNSIAPARCDELQSQLGLDRWDKAGRERVLKELDLDRIRDECACGEPFEGLFRSSSERYVVFRLNLGWSQSQIREAFGNWLREAFAPPPGKPAAKIGHLARSTTGRGLNRQAVLAWMNRLVALRWGRHFLEDWEECEMRIRGRKVKKLGYKYDSAWVRAQYDAADLLRRLEFAWCKHWVGAVHDILEPRRFTHQPGCRRLTCKLPWSKSPKGRLVENQSAKATAELREYIQKQVR
ncbi:MAG: hypothetical protein RL514_2661 [Verrucomicrobiota bacterium]|jgi:hypothetical protein